MSCWVCERCKDLSGCPFLKHSLQLAKVEERVRRLEEASEKK